MPISLPLFPLTPTIMAKTIPTLTLTLTLTTAILLLSLLVSGKSHTFSRSLSQKKLKREKLSHLHFYFHDIVSGKKPTAVRVAEATATNTSPTGFGAVVMIDDRLTVRPELTSREVGRAQGIYASAAQNEVGLLMVLNFAFSEGKYNGSSLSVLGRNTVFSPVRELPIVGGSGLFRFARGYARAKTHWFNLTSGDAVVEYNVYVFHY
ncbi:dirigent protein 22-like [Actinidia eriantha]|uniref:dirigent protein 22-like n=1 Tax=Actinidia eriantha TaxID=165200 RepID=UPI00258A8FA6|nr:dirigent protein 22-like [Actinidia eriantha]